MERTWMVLSWAIAMAALLSGAVLAVCQVSPDNLVAVDAYSRLFTGHTSFGLALLPLLLVPMAREEWHSAPRFRGAALGLVAGGTCLMATPDLLGGAVLGTRVPYLAAPFGALVHCLGSLVFAYATARHGHERRAARSCRAAALVCLGAWLGLRAISMLLGELADPTQSYLFDPHVLLALTRSSGMVLGIGIALAATAAPAIADARNRTRPHAGAAGSAAHRRWSSSRPSRLAGFSLSSTSGSTSTTRSSPPARITWPTSRPGSVCSTYYVPPMSVPAPSV